MGVSRGSSFVDPTRRRGGEDYERLTYSQRAATNAKRLRKEQTVGERALWGELRKLKLNIRRQSPIGPYVVDFVCHRGKLIIEVDGYYHQAPERQERDTKRDAWLAREGYRVVRFSDRDATNRAAEIAEEVRRLLALPPRGGKGWVGGVVPQAQEEPRMEADASSGLSGNTSRTPPTPALPPSRGKGGLRGRVYDVLSQVPDPEIPAVSVVDLGIVRGVRETPSRQVVITPTYTGCPATAVIHRMVREALDDAGLQDFDIVTELHPAWTTDWISDEGREKLRVYGIAPPPKGAADRSLKADTAECPQCGSSHTEEISRFGSTPCKAQWRCLDCAEPFDRFKCH